MEKTMEHKIKQSSELIKDNLISKYLAGSRAYGMDTPESDFDYRGIFVAEPINIRTPFFNVEECKDTSEEDTVIYELNQFMKLAVANNPNVIEGLWTNNDDIVFSTPAYEFLRSFAPELLTAQIAFTTSGYAYQQIKRIKGHNKWINNVQPELPPRQSDFISLIHNFTGSKIFKVNLSERNENYRLVPYSGNTYGVYPMTGYSLFNEETGNLNTEYAGDSHSIGAPLYIIKFNKEEYNNAKDVWTNYWTWKKNRNVKRSALEEQNGYDTKHASHVVRLLRMGAEALQTGELLVKRPDAEELLAIRNGAWTYEELVYYAEKTDKWVREVLYKQTKLPKSPNYKLAAKIIMNVQDMVWSR